jgi:hypothetical protein
MQRELFCSRGAEAGNFRVAERHAGMGPRHLGQRMPMCLLFFVSDYVYKNNLLGEDILSKQYSNR